jgi:hypothetical protein
MEQEQDGASLLAKAAQAPQGIETEEYNPMENIPTIAVGKQWAEKQTINGYFVETQRCTSAKFTNAKERDPATGLGVQFLHVFRLASGDKLGVWSTGELANVCEKLKANEFISITYKGKGTNAQGRQQHFFEYRKAKSAQH